ncbi:MAG: Mg(2+)-transport-ATPase-associated protein MgtC [uncultured Caballeronia sp.]|nr:MAG: Mg(2+)-transport-ATPase-associated protein MgtC [uncultured Caballeronia sp.]
MLSNVELISRLVLAAALGSVIGFERERLSWAAGLRTHMLVCVGSTLIMMVSAFGFFDVLSRDHVVLDPSRIATQVVSGIGFLGAGSILLRGEIVRGLTTAASLWSVAAIRLAVGGGMYTASITATAIILIILAGIKPLERRFISVKQRRQLTLLVDHGTLNFHALHEVLGAGSVRVKQFVVQQSDDSPDLDKVQIQLSRVSSIEYEAICTRLRALETVREFTRPETMRVRSLGMQACDNAGSKTHAAVFPLRGAKPGRFIGRVVSCSGRVWPRAVNHRLMPDSAVNPARQVADPADTAGSRRSAPASASTSAGRPAESDADAKLARAARC